jgi:hypothetical protein
MVSETAPERVSAKRTNANAKNTYKFGNGVLFVDYLFYSLVQNGEIAEPDILAVNVGVSLDW